ncbi:MAG: energy transducer TonB family protein [Terriglobia bacterium]
MNSDPVIHFYLDEETEVQRWRRRSALLLALLIEVLFIVFLVFASKYIRHHEQILRLEAEAEHPQEHTVFLTMPPDLLKELRRTHKTNILSDKNRLAHGPSPVVNPKGLRMPYMRGNTHLPKIAGGSPPPKQMTPPAQARPATQGTQTARAESPPKPKPPPQAVPKPKIMLANVKPPPTPSADNQFAMATPGEAIQQSLSAAARGRRIGQIPGPGSSIDQLNNRNPNFTTSGPIILSDTRGVDFGPYLAMILEIVRQNWYAVIPESARLGEQGRVAIVFEILKDGSVPQLRLVSSSGKVPLDRGAIAGIRASIPFPPLPSQFTGKHLVLQFNFFYNMNP